MDKPSAASDGATGPVPSTGAQSNNNTPSRIAVPSSSSSAAAVTPVTNGVAHPASKPSSAANSNGTTPNASRDGSPGRLIRKATSSSRLSGTRSRKNSQQELSPTRPSRSQIPTHTSSTRSLSTSATPSLPPGAKEATATSTPQKNGIAATESKESPRWPVSPRLRSPPPNSNKSGPATPKPEPDLPAINVLQASPSVKPIDTQLPPESETDEPKSDSGVHTPVRTGLETVQEVATPAADRGIADHVKEKLAAPDPQSDGALSDGGRTMRARSSQSPENGVEGAGRADTRRTTSVPPPPVGRQSSSLSMKQGKGKTEGSTQNMTVETETVASIPQVALNTSASKADGTNGTLKTKQSTETIKPKKDKKKTVRKQPNVTSASKADNFEAKIASAVDEANTSDSEETFVYDSNPPDNGDRTVRRFHSRTPSATSMASQPPDRQNVRSIYGVMEGGSHHHGPVPKKSMKFVNTFNGSGTESLTPGEEDGKATGRSAGGSGRGTARHHHHIGRWGRQPNNSHLSLFDNESPFANTARGKVANNTVSRNSSGPTSPRNHHSPRGQLNTKRSSLQMASIYDMDENTGADDERTPLIGTARYSRSGRNRRGPHSLRQAESQTYTRRSSYLNRFAACLVLTMMFLLVITGAIGFMFATSQPMAGIEIVSIQNVVTSEQVLIFDLSVKAHNPNIVLITVDHTDLEIFAKSDHAGTDSDWWKEPQPGDDVMARASGKNKKPKDKDGKDDDEEEDKRPNILLGRITEFDSPLSFEGSLFHQGSSTSTGEMKLQSPGNGTAGGTKRWDRIYQNEFDLIIKGVLKYTLPLSARVRSATVSGRTTVKPNSANDPSLRPPNSTAPAVPAPDK
ncbi:hypothetical protein PWT90_10969 [Aphanocladium album]|nr:hypothetical protein PWT90_10969 [Aphanocladium album]